MLLPVWSSPPFPSRSSPRHCKPSAGFHKPDLMRKAALLIPVLFLAQAGLVRWASGAEHPPAIPDLSRPPTNFGLWRSVQDDPIGQDVRDQLQADQLISRTYQHSGDFILAN